MDGGISEYEDEAEYAPSGCVSFLTIHQSKGMEFPIVLVDSLSNVPRKTYKDLMIEVEEKYFHRPAFEPYDQTKYFDFWRLYYTAFSRAQNLLVLTCDENKRTPSQYFRDIYDEIQSVDSDEFDLSEFSFQSVKKVNLKNSFSFTSHITVYETCALQYKLQGVFIADRNNGEFLEKVKLLVDKAVRRADNLINIRGVVMDTTSDFDNKIRDLISISWPLLGDKETKIVNDIKKRILQDNIKTAQKLDNKYIAIDKDNINDLLNERDFTAIRQARLLSWCIESNEVLKKKLQELFKNYLQLKNGDENSKFFNRYSADIIKYRNALAHVKNAPSTKSEVIIGEVDGQLVKFDQELCDELRKKLLNYEKVLEDMYKYIENEL